MSNDGLGLGKLPGLNLSSLLEPSADKFREIPLEDIREDGDNPRSEFDMQTLEELATTIRTRGVISPISVRSDPEREGGFVINHGHRRFRASKLAGRDAIPAVVDENFQDEDRIIENIQRDNLGMFEIAHYISGKLAQGIKQKDIAARIGKSTAYVSNHAQLLELPSATAKAVAQGKVNDVTAINELAKAEKRDPAATDVFLSRSDGISRSAAQDFRMALRDAGKTEDKAEPGAGERPGNLAAKFPGRDAIPTENVGPLWHRGRVRVARGSKRGTLLLTRQPRNKKHVWVAYDDGEKREEALAKLRMFEVLPE